MTWSRMMTMKTTSNRLNRRNHSKRTSLFDRARKRTNPRKGWMGVHKHNYTNIMTHTHTTLKSRHHRTLAQAVLAFFSSVQIFPLCSNSTISSFSYFHSPVCTFWTFGVLLFRSHLRAFLFSLSIEYMKNTNQRRLILELIIRKSLSFLIANYLSTFGLEDNKERVTLFLKRADFFGLNESVGHELIQKRLHVISN